MNAPHPAGDADRPLVTLFVFAYRQQDTVREAIEAAFAQTYGPLEILLSDDASPDGTFEVMRRMAESYRGPHRVTLNRNARNLGIVAHLDRIAEIAAGELLVQNGGDDISEPDRVAALIEAWRASGPTPESRAALVHSEALRIDAAGRPLGVRRPSPVVDSRVSPEAFLRGNMYVIGATQMWARRLHRRFGPLSPTALVEDRALPFRALLDAGAAFVDRPLLRYRAGGVSETEDGGDPAAARVRRLLYRRWYVSCYRTYARDLDAAGGAELDPLRAICAQELRLHELRLAAAERTGLARLALIPEALRLAVRRREPEIAADLARAMAGAWRAGAAEGRERIR
ncbi:glycosyltransferase [Oceanicella actignis]|uniref:Glycosyl transferase family 2 n=1 Tax=Oceanicella actignis TaxID=1189325 RepID=A0A1M7T4Q7_9RHOB|nr:glycosyltransferase [Oceanicella actignis]SET42197.1 Glycosyl transferase family 2 [Oceanicella actignis]SHN65719.1 Glycosyl transferase family 2 [Oceanicella actignis]